MYIALRKRNSTNDRKQCMWTAWCASGAWSLLISQVMVTVHSAPPAARLLLPGTLLQTPSVVWPILWSLLLSVALQMLLLLPRKLSLPVPGSWLLLSYEPKWPLLWEFPSCRGAGRSPLTPGLPQPRLHSWYSTSFLLAFLCYISISLKKSVLNIHWKDGCWRWNSNTLATWWEEPTHWKRPWCWERLKVGGEGDDGGWDG